MPKRVLLIIESCNPEWSSVPLVGYNFFNQILKFTDVTLVTHERNKTALEKSNPDARIIYIRPSKIESLYYKIISRASTFRGAVIWPLRHALQFPLYFFFDQSVDRMFKDDIKKGKFDLVHALTPILPRYPVKISRRCTQTPFILGPINGGVPFPNAFKARGRKEFAQLNFLRKLGALVIPNYRATYRSAELILAGSTYTKNWIEQNLHIPETKIELVFENAVGPNFYQSPSEKLHRKNPNQILKVLFIGRLVPYKGADMLINALKDVADAHLTIVGDGPERSHLEALAKKLGISERTSFTGWVPQHETVKYYQDADLFCFPSVREFGGAVVMEAMATGLPCIVVDNGGIGEYVTDSCGYKITPQGEKFVTEEITKILKHLTQNMEELRAKSDLSFIRAAEFSWTNKRDQMKALYDKVCLR